MAQNYFIAGLSLTGRKCLVIGKGQEAEQRFQSLKEAGAQVILLSEDHFLLDDLNDQFLVYYCDYSNRKMAEKISKRCREKRILVCTIDQPDLCDVVNLSLYQRGDLKVGISTGGAAPALAKKFRQGLEKSLKDVPLDGFLSFLSALRERYLKEIPDAAKRREALIKAVDGFELEAKVKLPNSFKKELISK